MTSGYQHCEDLAHWNTLAGRTFGPIEVRSRVQGFRGGMSVCDWPSVRLVDVQSTPARVEGGAPRHPGWFILFNRGGLCRVRQRGCDAAISQGEMTLLRADDAYEIWFDEPNRMQIAALPALALPAGLQQGLLRRYGVEEASVVGALLAQLRALSAPDRRLDRVALQRLLADLVLMATPEAVDDAEGARAGTSQARLARLQSLVSQRLDDPDLDAAELAHALGVSVRAVQKLLAAQGTTLGAYRNELRLQRAADLLRSRPERIADIALQVGFGDISHFCRCFRRRFGCSARQWRAGA